MKAQKKIGIAIVDEQRLIINENAALPDQQVGNKISTNEGEIITITRIGCPKLEEELPQLAKSLRLYEGTVSNLHQLN